jgi:hypothetical protein
MDVPAANALLNRDTSKAESFVVVVERFGVPEAFAASVLRGLGSSNLRQRPRWQGQGAGLGKTAAR